MHISQLSLHLFLAVKLTELRPNGGDNPIFRMKEIFFLCRKMDNRQKQLWSIDVHVWFANIGKHIF